MLKNMVALVTGGAGSLGLATVKKLVDNQCKVMSLDLPESNKDAVTAAIGDNGLFYGGNITSAQDLTNAYDTIKREFGRLDVIVNCAAISRARTLFNANQNRTANLEEFQSLINVNVTGIYNVIRLGVPVLAQNQPDEDGLRGLIINTSGFGATNGQMGQVMLSSAWGAIHGMTLPLCRDLSPLGIRVMEIAPGLMDSNLTSMMPAKVTQCLAKVTPGPKRLGKPEEYANLVVSIITNPFLNGEMIRLDGGLTLNFH